MIPRVLLVDDDELVLATQRRALRGAYEVEVAHSGAEALRLLEEEAAFAVVVADMNMPEMSGLDLLVAAKARAPETMRIMLTMADDQKTAVDAVNEGRIFRFLTKPCAPKTFVAAVREAAEQYQVIRHERALLEQTCNGLVQVLTGMLLSTEPGAPGPDQQLRERARQVGQLMKLPATAELETAALLARLGIATIPRHVFDKLRENDRLTTAESELLARIPEIGVKVLEHIPRLAGVAEIFRHQNRDPAPNRLPDDEATSRAPKREVVPLASRILRALVDLQILEDSGLRTAAGLIRLRQNSHRYDPAVLKTLTTLYGDPALAAAEVEEHMIEDLMPGMVLAADALSDQDVSLVAAGTDLTDLLIKRLRNFAELGELVQPLRVLRVVARSPAAPPSA